MQTLNVNESRMKEIAKSNVTSYSLMLYFALRERHTSNFNVRVLKTELIKSGVPVNDKDLYEAMDQLQKENLGVIVYGQNGMDDNFKWNYKLTQFNRTAFEPKVLKPILKKSNSVKTRKSNFYNAVREYQGLPVIKRAPGRPKGSKNRITILKTKTKTPVKRPKKAQEKEIVMTPAPVSFDKRILAIPLKGNRDIKIEMPSNLTQDEVALLSLTISEIIG